jgi:hypothetical protein
LHQQLATALQEQSPEQSDENAALIAEHLEAAGDLRAAYSWHMRAGAWSTHRDIAAAHVSWERARQIADGLAEDDPDRLEMRIAPRTLLCANGFRIHAPDVDARFDELQELCTAAGDKVSSAIAMAGLVGDHMTRGRVREAAQISLELTSLLESIGQPTLSVALAVSPAAMAMTTGDMAETLRLSQWVIDLADSDPTDGSFTLMGSPLSYAYGSRSLARSFLGLDGWQDDFHRAVAMARNADPMSQGIVVAITYAMAIGFGSVLADDAALRDIQVALDIAGQSADDLALGFALTAMGVALVHSNSAGIERGLQLLGQAREMSEGGRFYRSNIPAIEAWIAHGMARLGDRDAAVPVLRSANDSLFDDGQFIYCGPVTRLLVQELLIGGTDAEVREAEAAIDRLAAVPALKGLAIQEVTLLGLRALLARGKGDERNYLELADRYLEMARSLGFEGHIAIAEAM